jgi:hypothetical protein
VSAIDDDLGQLQANALPSIDDLLAVRSELRTFMSALDSYRVDLAEGWPLAPYERDRMGEARARLDEARTRYERANSFYPGERAVFDKLRDDLARVGELADREVELADAKEHEAARLSHYQRLRPANDAAMARIGELIEMNARWAREHGGHARGLRRRFALVSLGGNALALAFAGALAWWTLRRLRDDRRVQHARAAAAEARAASLDAAAARVAAELRGPLARARRAVRRVHDRGPAIDLAESLASVGRALEALEAFGRSAHPDDAARPLELAAAVASAVDDVAPHASAASVRITVEPVEPLDLACDPAAVHALLVPMLRRAVDGMGETPLRRVSVRVEDRGERARIEVFDTGHGLARFARAATDEGDPPPSAGRIALELAAIERTLQRAGGQLGRSLEPGGGCRVWVELPKAPAGG